VSVAATRQNAGSERYDWAAVAVDPAGVNAPAGTREADVTRPFSSAIVDSDSHSAGAAAAKVASRGKVAENPAPMAKTPRIAAGIVFCIRALSIDARDGRA